MENISLNTKLEVAIEIMAAKIALCSKKGQDTNDLEMRKLLKEREEMYIGNQEVIEKIIKEYAPEIKNNYKKV